MPKGFLSVPKIEIDKDLAKLLSIPIAKVRRTGASRKLLTELYRRQKGKCPLCKKKMFMTQIDKLQVDHKLPISKGGSDSIRNKQLVHRKCNLEKGSKIIRKPRSKSKLTKKKSTRSKKRKKKQQPSPFKLPRIPRIV